MQEMKSKSLQVVVTIHILFHIRTQRELCAEHLQLDIAIDIYPFTDFRENNGFGSRALNILVPPSTVPLHIIRMAQWLVR